MSAAIARTFINLDAISFSGPNDYSVEYIFADDVNKKEKFIPTSDPARVPRYHIETRSEIITREEIVISESEDENEAEELETSIYSDEETITDVEDQNQDLEENDEEEEDSLDCESAIWGDTISIVSDVGTINDLDEELMAVIQNEVIDRILHPEHYETPIQPEEKDFSDTEDYYHDTTTDNEDEDDNFSPVDKNSFYANVCVSCPKASDHIDDVIVVYRAGQTKRRTLSQAKDEFDEAEQEILAKRQKIN